MAANRRQFLQVAGAGLVTAALPRLARADELKRSDGLDPVRFRAGAWPILQGPSDATTASFLILHPLDQPFSLLVRGPDGIAFSAAVVDRFPMKTERRTLTEALATGLVPGVTYRLQVVGADGRGIDERTFRSLDIERKSLKFVVGSCMNDRFAEQGAAVWNAVAREEPDAVFLIGDTVYADQNNWAKDDAGYVRRYTEARDKLAWFRMPHLVPTFSTWDDHDFGINDGDKSFPRAMFTKNLFRRFFGGTENAAWKKTFGVGSVLRAGGQRFYLLDDRTWRDAPRTQLGKHLGTMQREWLLADLAKSSEPAWLLNGSQFFGAYQGFESYEADHADDFKDLLAKLSKLSAPVAFVSGDIHTSELMEIEPAQLGYRTYELTSSSLHSFSVPYMDARALNPRRLASEWRYNFLAVDSRVDGTWKSNVRCVTSDHVAFERAIEVVRG